MISSDYFYLIICLEERNEITDDQIKNTFEDMDKSV